MNKQEQEQQQISTDQATSELKEEARETLKDMLFSSKDSSP
jgi:hypothetical protein